MRVVKFGIISVAVMVIMVLLISLLFPSEVIVSRATDISAPSAKIDSLVRDMRLWNQWVEGMNLSIVKVYNADSALLGNTIVSLIAKTDSTYITKWEAANAPAQISTIRLITGGSASTTTVVQWQFVQHLHWYPWEKFGSMMNDKIIGARLEQNLANLKKLAEK